MTENEMRAARQAVTEMSLDELATNYKTWSPWQWGKDRKPDVEQIFKDGFAHGRASMRADDKDPRQDWRRIQDAERALEAERTYANRLTKCLNKLIKWLEPDPWVPAVFISPSEKLRMQASRLDQRESDLNEAKQIIANHEVTRD